MTRRDAYSLQFILHSDDAVLGDFPNHTTTITIDVPAGTLSI